MDSPGASLLYLFQGEGVVGVGDTFVVMDYGGEQLTHSCYSSDVTEG